MKKINVAELLKDCPKGMELNCLMYDGCTFDGIIESEDYPIKIQAPDGAFVFTKYGSMSEIESAKCVIFPKGKTTWEGFQRPFKDGDIVATADSMWIGITAGGNKKHIIPTYCIIQGDGKFEAYLNKKGKWAFDRVATEEEKEALFKAIKENGYSWNAETKTLEKLVEPKFKLGQNIRIKGESTTHIVTEVRENLYILDIKDISLPFENQDQWELVPNKFDITTLKPFDKVLVRDEAREKWRIEFFSHIHSGENVFICHKYNWMQCIPYEGNEHLLNTTDNCADFYITWE